jgi:tetratricopeptide (TPR) repeat protein
VALALVLAAAAGFRAAAPPPAPARRLADLEARGSEKLLAGEFAKALRLGGQSLALRQRMHGTRHWQVVDARLELECVRRLARLPAGKQRELAQALRLGQKAGGLESRQQWAAAEKVWRQALAGYRKALGEEHPDTATGYAYLANNLYGQGKYSQAQPLYEKALAIRRKALGKDHPDTGRAASTLAENLYAQTRYDQAQPLYEKALAIFRKALGEEHPDTATGYISLAKNLNVQGKYDRAQLPLEKGLAIRKKVLGEQHPDTAAGYASVASNLYAQRSYDKAQPLFEKALAIWRKALGEDHLDTANGYDGLAANLSAQVQYAKAQPLYERALAIRKKVLGEEHPETASSLNNLALNLHTQGKYAKAQPFFEKALAIKRKARGEGHPDTATGYVSLAENLHAQGKYDKAQPLYEKGLAIYRKVLGEEHPSTAVGYNNLATNLRARGEYDKAHPLYEKALAINRKALGEEHPDTATGYNNLGINLNPQGKYNEAHAFFERALAIRRRVLGEEHPDTAVSYNNVAANLHEQGKYGEAQPLYDKALAIRRKALGEKHPLTAQSYGNVAANLSTQGQYDKAQSLYEKALAIFGKALGEEHPSTAGSYNNVAYNLYAQAKYARAQPYYEKALALRRKALGKMHPDAAQSCNNLAVNLSAQGKDAQAQSYYEEGLAVLRKVLGEEHPLTASGYTNLAYSLAAQGKYDQAVRQLRAALAGHDVGRLDSNASGFDRSLFSAQGASPRPLLAACLARLGRPKEAWRHAEADLARGLLDELPADAGGSGPDSRTVRAQLRRLDERLVPLLSSAELPAGQRALRDDLVGQRRRLLAALARQAAARSTARVRPLSAIQEQIPADAALLLWVDAGRQHFGCVLRKHGPPAWEPLPGSGPKGAWTASDDRLPLRLYAALADPAKGAAGRERLARALLRQRLEPLRRHLGRAGKLPKARRLLVVAAGAMALVPLEALAPEYTVSYVPSGSVFARLAKGHRPLAGAPLLALGDPDFTPPKAPPAPEPPGQGLLLRLVLPGGNAARAGLRAGDVLLSYAGKRLKSPADLKAAQGEGTVRAAYWRAGKEGEVRLRSGPLGAVLDERPAPAAVAAWRQAEAAPVKRGGYQRLPGSRREVEALARLVGRGRATLLLGSQASEQRLERLRRQEGGLKRFRLLHLATHGRVDWQAPARSALVLAQDRLPGPREALEAARAGRTAPDGHLRVSAVLARWRLDCDLVVLSACESGLGKSAGGEGLLGFAQAFLQKGARGVVLSRWKVDDTATALLMLRFYENLLGKRDGLKKPLGRAAALQEARSWLRRLDRAAAGRLGGGVLRGTERPGLPPVKKGERPALPAGERPFAHPAFWAAFVLLGDPD